ncbi:unnamed protein product [Owenia fusiformis]|uniref:Uncharacterized protein n=1 Tax=Owenia fusiformis TaxID=6347 RepID=A0A8S4QAH5_OWEFU|nr:unnamed protein product [Owenia fusiformis]
MPKIVPYVDDPQVWKKFIRAQVEGRVIDHAGYGKRGKLKWIPVSSVRQPIVQHISPTEAVVQRAKAEIERQQQESRDQETLYKRKRKAKTSVPKKPPSKKHKGEFRAQYKQWTPSK